MLISNPMSTLYGQFIYSDDVNYLFFLSFLNESALTYMTVTALRLEPGLEVEGEGGVQVEVLHVDAQLEKTGCVVTQSLPYTLQRQNAENLKQIFPKKEYRGLISTFMCL